MARIFQQRLASTTLAAALLVALTAPAMAQPAPPAPATASTQAEQAPADGSRGGPRHHRAPSPEKFKEHQAQRAAQLKQKLNITPAQEPAWTTFTTAMQPPARDRHAGLDHKGMEQLTTPERIDRMRAIRAQRSAEMDRRDEAVKTFYATLSPEQQKTFDAEGRRMHQRMDGHRGHRDGKPDHGARSAHRGAPGEQGKATPQPPVPRASAAQQ